MEKTEKKNIATITNIVQDSSSKMNSAAKISTTNRKIRTKKTALINNKNSIIKKETNKKSIKFNKNIAYICIAFFAVLVIFLCVILGKLIKASFTNNSVGEVFRSDNDKLFGAKYSTENGAVLSFCNNNGSLFANVELIQSNDMRYYWTMFVNLDGNKLVYDDCDYTITYDYGTDDAVEAVVNLNVMNGYFTVKDDNTIVWNGCHEEGLRDYTFFKE